MGRKQPISEKGSLRREDSSAMGKGKSVSKVSISQLRGSAMKFGSKKLWTTLIPSISGCRQGVRSRSEPLMHEKPSSDCDALPKEAAFEAGTQMDRRFNASPLTFSRSSKFRKRCSGKGASSKREDADNQQRSSLKASILSKGKEKLHKSSNIEDRVGSKGFVHRGSSITVFRSNPIIREKNGSTLWGLVE